MASNGDSLAWKSQAIRTVCRFQEAASDRKTTVLANGGDNPFRRQSRRSYTKSELSRDGVEAKPMWCAC